MKKLLALLLALTFVFAFAACGGSETASTDDSSADFGASSEDASEESSEDISEDVSEDASEDASEDTSEESGEAEELPAFISNFVSIGAVDTAVRATSANAIQLTGIDDNIGYGTINLCTPVYGTIKADDVKEDYAMAVFTYSGEYFGYVMTEFYNVGEIAADAKSPEDGFIILAHKAQSTYIAKLNDLKGSTETVFPHGLHLYEGADVTIKKASAAINVDGSFNAEEWEAYHVGEIKPESPNWSYAQFDAGNYYSLGNYYMTYDDSYVYLAVVIKSPYHFCPIAPDTAGDMWKYECIQVKASEVSPAGDYIAENYDHVINKTAHNEGVVHSYGFAANDSGETCFYESGTDFTGLAGCSRDDATQTTVYEVAIAWESLEITPEEGVEFGLTFSVNSTSEEDFNNGGWKNVTLRNGGGVIGRNDWSKIPVITLG
ncbi:MAG: hypothetical protein IKZ23_03570 [Clostridia bacterium]|nr:hypothetical protein [Clostridia bacterium]